MKKIIFGILSLLLITPVFADTIDLGSHFSNFISFESLNSSNNITYGGYSISNWYSPNRTDFFYFDSSLSSVYNIGYLESSYNSYGSSFDGFPFDFSGDTITNYSLNSNHYYGLLGIGFNNNKLINGFFSMYFQSINSSYLPNKVLNFGASPNSGYNYIYPHDSYIRALYSGSSFWFNNNSFPISSISPAASEIQIFTKGSNTFYDTKGLVSVNNQFISNISSSVGNGFSFVSDLGQLDTVYYDDLDFYSVLPYWDSSWSSSVSSFSIPSSSYVQGIYIFKNNSFSRNSNYEDIGVISKCNTVLCSGLDLTSYLSTLVVSNYLCDFSSNFGIKNNCILVGGGFLTGVLGSITGLDQPLTKTSLSLIFFDSKTVSTYYNSLGYSYSFLSSPYSLNLTHFVRDGSNHSISKNSFPISYITGYSISNPPDILSTYDFIQEIPSDSPVISGDVITDLQNLYCIQNPTSPYCNGIYTGSRDETRCVVDSSGFVKCYFTDFSRPATSEDCPTIESGLDNGQVFIQYWNTGENRCIQGVSASIDDSSPLGNYSDLYSGSELSGISDKINLAFSGLIGENFKFYSCPFNSPFRAFRLGSIGGLSDLLLDKFFDINIIGPFSCLLGGILYSEISSESLGSSLLSYDGQKFFESFPDNVKQVINWVLFAGMILFFWSFRPKEH